MFIGCAVGKRDFLGGKAPSLADLQVFGVLRAISATDTFQVVINETDILPWWTRMVTQVAESACVEDMLDDL
jgi:glutathione S-transferase